MSKYLQRIFSLDKEPEVVRKVNIRSLSPSEYEQLQRIISTVKDREAFKGLPSSPTQYRNQARQEGVSMSYQDAKSDFIFVWTRALQSYINTQMKKAKKLADKYGNFSDSAFRVLSGGSEKNAQNILNFFEHNITRLARLQKGAYRLTPTKAEKQLLTNRDYTKIPSYSISDFGGSYALLAYANLVKALDMQGGSYIVNQYFSKVPVSVVLDFWRNNKDLIDLTFMYSGVSTGGNGMLEFELLFYHYLPAQYKKLVEVPSGYDENDFSNIVEE